MLFFQKLQNHQIILASQSPRRRDLLQAAGIPFVVEVREVPEEFPAGLPPEEVALLLSRKKAMAFSDKIRQENIIVIAADTIVSVEGEILNKPGNDEEARQMLLKLSGRCHSVVTGVCIAHAKGIQSFAELTRVWFRDLQTDEIDFYINQYHPFDKAGAYGIQEWIGHIAVTRIEGLYSTVVGLPVERVYVHLKALLEG